MRSRATTLGRWSSRSSSSSKALGPRRRSSSPRRSWRVPRSRTNSPNVTRMDGPDEKPRIGRGLPDVSRRCCALARRAGSRRPGRSETWHGREGAVGAHVWGSRSSSRSWREAGSWPSRRGVASSGDDDQAIAGALAGRHVTGDGDGLCGGEPCDAVARGFVHFFDRSLEGHGRKRALVRRLPHGDGPLPALARERRAALPAPPVAAPVRSRRRRPAVPADRRRRLPDQRRETRATSATCARTASSGSSFHLPANVKLIDPATNAPVRGDVGGRVASGPDRQRREAHRVRTGRTHGRAIRTATGGYQLDARLATLQDQALGALTNHAQVQDAPSQQFLDDLHSFQRVLFTNDRVRALADAIDAGIDPLPDPDPPLNALEQQGKVVFARACAQCHGGPGQSSPPGPRRSLPRHLRLSVRVRSIPSRRRALPSSPARRASPATHGRTRSRWRTAPRSAGRAPIPVARC